MSDPKYLIGYGENLSVDIARPPSGFGDKAHPYTFEEAVSRLSEQWADVSQRLIDLPAAACPGGQATIEITLHPAYLAKTYYPETLVKFLNLTHLGSRSSYILPQKRTSGKREPEQAQLAPRIFLAGHRDTLLQFCKLSPSFSPQSDSIKGEYRCIEKVGVPGIERFKGLSERYADRASIPLEIVLHAPESFDNRATLQAFSKFISEFGGKALNDRARFSGGLAFLPALAPREHIEEIAEFSLLRVAREAPRIAPMEPLFRGSMTPHAIDLPSGGVDAPELSVAIFDGGLPSGHTISPWVAEYDAPGVGAPIPALQGHGLAVTSAFLFGPLSTRVPPNRPTAAVDHWRVLGTPSNNEGFEAFDVLDSIEAVLRSRQYDFVNISLGPDYAIDDDEVSPWTSRLDAVLSHGNTIASVACGNNGERDQEFGLNRVQPPSDGVNVLAVGAADELGDDWKRSSYSAIGPGRSPGYVKPDILAFGGHAERPFLVLSHEASGQVRGEMGTSFAAPVALRSASVIRAKFQENLWAPSIKALLIHRAEQAGNCSSEVGWGRLPSLTDDLVECEDGEAHILYQRQLPPSGAVRLYLPVPINLPGNIELNATFCFFSDVDPEDSLNYTRSGLEIQFRPNLGNVPAPYWKGEKLITPTLPKTSTFFSSKKYYSSEYERRTDAHKWETTKTATKTMRATSLHSPVFDVSYIGREHGHSARREQDVTFPAHKRNRASR